MGAVSASNRGVTLETAEGVYQFDAAGRLRTCYDGRRIYRRGIGNTTVAVRWQTVETDAGPVRGRAVRRVPTDAARGIQQSAYESARAVLEDEAGWNPPAATSIAAVREGSPAALERTAERAREIYGPIGVLPPDQYPAVVLQASRGCPYACSFCDLYEGVSPRHRSVAQFRDHAVAVRDLFGRGLQSRRGVFLGDADPLAAPADRCEAILETVRGLMPQRWAEGVAAFLTARTAARRSVEHFERLAESGLTRVHVGVESGSETVLELLEKPQTPAVIRSGVETVKAAGLSVGLVVLAGAGGRTHGRVHERETLSLLESLPLESTDIVYVSPLSVPTDGPYHERCRRGGVETLSAAGILAETARLRERITAALPARVARYTVDEGVYC